MQGRKLVIVEGNIAAGKSTLCKEMAQILNYALFIEPTDKNPYLELYYKDPKKYAFEMQIWFLKQRFTTYCQAIRILLRGAGDDGKEINGVILDRSIFSDSVFAKQNCIDGHFSEEQYQQYLQLRNKLLDLVVLPHVVLYLDASPETCYDRIHKLRKRAGEEVIPLAYLTGLSNCYELLIDELKSKAGTEVAIVPWNTFGSTHSVCQIILDRLFEHKKHSSFLKTEAQGNVREIDSEAFTSTSKLNIISKKIEQLQNFVATDEDIKRTLEKAEEECSHSNSTNVDSQRMGAERCKSPLTVSKVDETLLFSPSDGMKARLKKNAAVVAEVDGTKRIISP